MAEQQPNLHPDPAKRGVICIWVPGAVPERKNGVSYRQMSKWVPLSFPLDSDGFLSQECPSCERRFKVKFSQEPDGKTLSYCPYCGHEGQNCWWTQEQVEYIHASATNSVVNPLLRDFQQSLRRLNNPSGGFTVKTSPIPDKPGAAPIESDIPMATHTFACCGETVKHSSGDGDLHCIVCGQREAGE